MSSVTRIRTRIKNGALLVESLRRLGHVLLSAREDEVIARAPGGREIRFVRAPGQTFELVGAQSQAATSDTELAAALDRQSDVEGELLAQQERQRAREERARAEARAAAAAESEELLRAVRVDQARESALSQLRLQGFQVIQQTVAEDGAIRIVARRWR